MNDELDAVIARLEDALERVERLERRLQARLEVGAGDPRTAGARAQTARERGHAERARAAASWVLENVPDLAPRGGVCPFAVQAALELRDEGSDVTPEAVRARRAQHLERLETPR